MAPVNHPPLGNLALDDLTALTDEMAALVRAGVANLFARTSVNSTSEFKVSVLDSSMNVVDSVIVDNSDVNGPTPGYDHSIDLTGVTGEFIRVETTSDSYLALAEVQVFAAVPEPSTIVLGGLGLIGLVGLGRSRRR